MTCQCWKPQCDNECGWTCHNSKTVNTTIIRYLSLAVISFSFLRAFNNFPIHELSTAGSIIKTPTTVHESTNVFKLLVYIYMFSSVGVAIYDRSYQCQLSLGIGRTRHFRIDALPASLMVFETYDSSKFTIRYAPNSRVIDSLSITPRRFCHVITPHGVIKPSNWLFTYMCHACEYIP